MFFDFPQFTQILFQDPATPIMEAIIDLHHNILFFLIVISVLVSYLLVKLINRWWFNWEYPDYKNWSSLNDFQDQVTVVNNRSSFLKISNIIHAPFLEIIWTLVPSLILVLIAIPSFALLYAIDEVLEPLVTVKIIGHQWYWSYEYSDLISSDFEELNFDSYMIPTTELSSGSLRLLEVDNPMVLPIKTQIRLIITSTDVLHSWAVPSLGVKVDAVPGRLNQASVFIKRIGSFYGQCSELCGVNHAFMPINVRAVSLSDYITFLYNK